jgi:hypothetical protein
MSCQAVKFPLPLFRENIEIKGVSSEPLPHLVQTVADKRLREVVEHV